jgi:hypothetical protein
MLAVSMVYNKKGVNKMAKNNNPLDPYFQEYQDRGIIKWAGFYLSEHTTALEKEKQQRIIPARLEQQTPEQIDYCLTQSLKYNKVLEIQLNTLENGQVKPHLWGTFTGAVDLETLAITDPISGFSYLQYSDIRHIKMHDFKKWSLMETHQNTANFTKEKDMTIDEFASFFNDENWSDLSD